MLSKNITASCITTTKASKKIISEFSYCFSYVDEAEFTNMQEIFLVLKIKKRTGQALGFHYITHQICILLELCTITNSVLRGKKSIC